MRRIKIIMNLIMIWKNNLRGILGTRCGSVRRCIAAENMFVRSHLMTGLNVILAPSAAILVQETCLSPHKSIKESRKTSQTFLSMVSIENDYFKLLLQLLCIMAH